MLVVDNSPSLAGSDRRPYVRTTFRRGGKVAWCRTGVDSYVLVDRVGAGAGAELVAGRGAVEAGPFLLAILIARVPFEGILGVDRVRGFDVVVVVRG